VAVTTRPSALIRAICSGVAWLTWIATQRRSRIGTSASIASNACKAYSRSRLTIVFTRRPSRAASIPSGTKRS
jgi:prolipoprotein diacylglyceryltransferase